jgi:hypothetical protein
MSGTLPRRARMLDFAIAAALIGAASLFLLNALSRLQEGAEKTFVEMSIRNLNSGLLLRQSELMIEGRENEFHKLPQENPVDWLPVPLEGYTSVAGCGAPAALPEAHWCWDARAKRLHYRPRRHAGLKIQGGASILMWRVQAPADPSAIRPGTLRIVPATPYEWSP